MKMMKLDEQQREDLKNTSDVYESMTSSSGSRMSGVIVFPIVTVALLLHSLKLFLLLIGCVIYLFNWL